MGRPDRARGIDAVVFDLGGVLLDWDPRHLYRRLLAEDEIEAFLAEVDLPALNRVLDLGAPFAETVAGHQGRYPARAELIGAFHHRWEETVAGEVPGMADLVDRLGATGVGLYLLSNSSAEKFALLRDRYPILDHLHGAVVSGQEGVAKPDPAIYALTIDRFGLVPARTLFVDDLEANVAGARRAGLQALLFSSAGQLEEFLRAQHVLGTGPAEARGAPTQAAGPSSGPDTS